MTAILGVSAYYHDSAAALVIDGRIVAAAQEERFTRRRHDHEFPQRAIDYCLAEAEIDPGDLDYVGFYDKPFAKFDRLLQTYLSYAPRGLRSYLQAMPLWLKQKLHLPRELHQGLHGAYGKRFVFAEHHESHAASAFFPSPFEEAAVLTMDGVGEWATTTAGVGRGNRITLDSEIRFPHSLGLLYSAFTSYCGFKVNSGEYKLMGLAPYGEPRYADLIRNNLIDVRPDGSFRLDLRYFAYPYGLRMTSRRFHDLFGGPPRPLGAEPTQRDMDIAASIQQVTEEVMVRAARHVRERTGLGSLCMAGGVALNCVANARVLRESGFERIWVQPAAGDAGGALGVALLIWHQLLGNDRTPVRPDAQQGSLLGPSFGSADVRAALDAAGAQYEVVADEPRLLAEVANLLADGNVVGWFQGRMEYGPRALGARSILGDPRDPSMQSVMNRKIKFRESFRPFAPSVLADHAADWFDGARPDQSPYMLLTAPVAAHRRLPVDDGAVGMERLRQVRSAIPAVTHVDWSARLQTVDERAGRYERLLRAFHRRTGCPVLVNTSFNVRGEPIVCTPQDAYRCFLATGMDALVVEDCLLRKSDQTTTVRREDHLAQFAPD